MSRHRTVLGYIDDMVEAGERAVRYTTGIDAAALARDEMRADALIRVLGVLGEACKRIPPDIRARFPDVPWRAIAGNPTS